MEKLKVIIIDDEMLIRKLIRMKMEMDKLHLELAGEYQDGADAIEHLQEVQPDIIISDICMPEVDGLSFSEACLQLFPDMKIIILTGYNDFDYARRGIKASVFDYLMKPVRADELNATLQRACNEILQLRQQAQKQNKLLEEMKRNLPALRDIYLNQALLQEPPDDDMEANLETYGIKISHETDCGIQLGMIAIKESIFELELTDQILEEAKSFFQSDTDILVFRDHWNRIVIVAGKADLPFAECLDILTAIIQEKYRCHFSLGLSERYCNWMYLHQSYVNALDDMQKNMTPASKNPLLAGHGISWPGSCKKDSLKNLWQSSDKSFQIRIALRILFKRNVSEASKNCIWIWKSILPASGLTKDLNGAIQSNN